MQKVVTLTKRPLTVLLMVFRFCCRASWYGFSVVKKVKKHADVLRTHVDIMLLQLHHLILLVGNLSFAASLGNAFGAATNMVAISLVFIV